MRKLRALVSQLFLPMAHIAIFKRNIFPIKREKISDCKLFYSERNVTNV